MLRMIRLALLFVLWTGFLACSAAYREADAPAPPAPSTAPAGPERCATAQEVIARNLEAIGGADRIRAVRTMTLEGNFGSALLTTAEPITIYLEKPENLKQQGAFRVTLFSNGRAVYNNGLKPQVLSGGNQERIEFRVGFYHNCFSLLKWEALFQKAELEEIKRYGDTAQYVILFPGGECGRDLRAYIDADTFLVDRIVYRSLQEGAGTIQVVNRLRNYETFDGILMPTRLVIDMIGWEASPSHLLIRDVAFNPVLEEGLFDSSDVDFGTVECEGDTIHAEILGYQTGYLLTNIRQEDLEAAGIPFKSWVWAEVGETRMKIRVLGNIQMSAAEIKPGEVYLTTYPICGFPRFMLLGWNMDVATVIPAEKGDALTITPIRDDGEENTQAGQDENH